LVIAGNEDGLVRRNAAGFCQEATPKTGAIWLSPAGVSKEIAITAPIPETAHLYLPTALFDRLKDDFNLPVAPADSIRNAAGIGDDVIDQIGRSILSEVTAETAAGRMYVEAASLALAARLLQKYCDGGACESIESPAHGLDHIRLRRVLEYVDANFKNDITLESLAGTQVTARFILRASSRSLWDPAGSLCKPTAARERDGGIGSGQVAGSRDSAHARFSSQASFTRAFHRATGITPKEYQRRRRKREKPVPFYR